MPAPRARVKTFRLAKIYSNSSIVLVVFQFLRAVKSNKPIEKDRCLKVPLFIEHSPMRYC